MNDSRSPRPKRRWYQFSLRTLLLLVLLVSLPLSWFAVKLDRASKERKAVAEIVKLGGSVDYDYEEGKTVRVWDATTGQEIRTMKPPGPVWLRRVFGEDFLVTVVEVSLANSQITDAGLQHLKRLTNLQGLNLYRTQVTDAGLEHFKGLTRLQRLNLGGSQVTDEGVKKLQLALPNCKIEH